MRLDCEWCDWEVDAVETGRFDGHCGFVIECVSLKERKDQGRNSDRR